MLHGEHRCMPIAHDTMACTPVLLWRLALLRATIATRTEMQAVEAYGVRVVVEATNVIGGRSMIA